VILERIAIGLRSVAGAYEVCADRAKAIERAVMRARPGDVVLVAGKGHENYQIVGNDKLPFDDRDEARCALALRRERGSQ
jgi:UDP-N-acetylmuramoyl-L-alanyl-D-glutamate--2,6-diaminopimelate ligase